MTCDDSTSIEFKDLIYGVPAHRSNGGKATQILHGITGYVGAGESLAILGPSGSGKTTLLNLLAGRSEYGLSGGEILFDGAPRTSRTKRKIGYVTQDDVFFSDLSVRETLDFTTCIRLPSNMSHAERISRIDETIDELRLTQCQNTRIGDQQLEKGISGGERKRLNIANEVICNPSVLLSDECTSGLDSASKYTVIQLLKRLSRNGKTVIATIHQPSTQIFQSFDKVMLLVSGRVAYFGAPGMVLEYFASIGFPIPSSSYNPADYMLDLITDDVSLVSNSNSTDEELGISPHQIAKRQIIEAWEQRGPHPYMGTNVTPPTIIMFKTPSEHHQTNENSIAEKKGPIRAIQKRLYSLTGNTDSDTLPRKYPSKFWTQLYALGKRTLAQKSTNLLKPTYIVQVMAVTLISLLFWFRMERTEDTIEDRLGALFFFPVFWSSFSVYTAVYTFPSERAVLNKDRASGAYRLSAYYLAKSMVEIPAEMLYPFLFCIIVYFSINLNPSFLSFTLFTVIIILNVLTCLSFGVLVSAILVNVQEAQVVGSIWILTSMLTGGYYINSHNIPVYLRPLRFLSHIKYSYETLVRLELRGSIFECVPSGVAFSSYSRNGAICPVTEAAVLEGAQLDNISIAGNIAILFAWVVILRALGYFALKFFNRRHNPKKTQRWKMML